MSVIFNYCRGLPDELDYCLPKKSSRLASFFLFNSRSPADSWSLLGICL